MESLLNKVTRMNVQKYQEKRKKKKKNGKRLIATIKPNTPAMAGKFVVDKFVPLILVDLTENE